MLQLIELHNQALLLSSADGEFGESAPLLCSNMFLLR